MRKLALATYAWKPELRSGVWRPMALAKYLPAAGWQPTIVTTVSRTIPNGPPPGRPADEFPLELVYPAGEERLFRLAKILHPLLKCVGKSGSWLAEAMAWRVFPATPEETFPDIGTGYARFIEPMAGRLLRLAGTGDYGAIFITCPPYSMVPLAATVAEKSPIPVVLDFRDPWVQCFTTQLTEAQQKEARKIERRAIQAAAAITVVSPRQQQDLRELYPDCAEKIYLVSNGYDPDDIPPVTPATEKFVLGLIGCSYDAAGELLEATRIAAEKNPEFAEKFMLRWVGPNQHAEDRVKAMGLGRNIDLCGPQPHDKTLELAAACSALWLETPFADGADYVIRGKVYEYMALGLPILGTAMETACIRELLAPVNARLIASRRPEDIAALWLEAFEDFKAGKLTAQPPSDYVQQFRRDHQAKQLAEILDSLD